MFPYNSDPWEFINRILSNCKQESEHRTVLKLTVAFTIVFYHVIWTGSAPCESSRTHTDLQVTKLEAQNLTGMAKQGASTAGLTTPKAAV